MPTVFPPNHSLPAQAAGQGSPGLHQDPGKSIRDGPCSTPSATLLGQADPASARLQVDNSLSGPLPAQNAGQAARGRWSEAFAFSRS